MAWSTSAITSPAQLHHWLRTVLRNQAARRIRDLHGAEFVSWDALQEAWARRR
jgi:hypothetical protein